MEVCSGDEGLRNGEDKSWGLTTDEGVNMKWVEYLILKKKCHE